MRTMPEIILSQDKHEHVIMQQAYDWYFADPQTPAHDPLLCLVTDAFTPIDLQLEMFGSQTLVDDYLIFKNFADQWRADRTTTSSITDIVLAPAYQAIIGMGPRAIGFILRELDEQKEDPDHWFLALQALTRSNPVRQEDEGNLQQMAAAWLKWAASKGYAW
jgi:hypothetical protein